MQRMFTVVGLGELLWDLLPDGKQLGGAPSNFAYVSTLLGDRGVVASRLGQDDLGRQARRVLRTFAVDVSFLQTDSVHPTGTVDVELDRGGYPRFAIHEHVAWDCLSWTSKWQRLARQADAVCFGTLAQRSPRSRATIAQFLKHVRRDAVRVFDVNLRQYFYSAEMLRAAIPLASIVKMNADELPVILRALRIRERAQAGARQILAFGPKLVCVTRGDKGSVLISPKRAVEHAGFRVSVVDTVGCGDAFTAALVHQTLRRASLTKISDAANRMGSWLASQAGGTPKLPKGGLERTLANLAAR